MPEASRVADVVIVGASGGGLVAALMARAHGLRPLVIEKSEYVGGTSAWSHGALWLPANPLAREDGLPDSVEEALAYIRATVGEDQGPATAPERQRAYVEGGDRLVRFLRGEGVVLRLTRDYPDYYPDAPGAKLDGRIVGAPLLDARVLGARQDWPRPRTPMPLGIIADSIEQFRSLLMAGCNPRAALITAGIMLRSAAMKARGVRPLVLGQAYIGHLLAAAQRREIEILRSTPFRRFMVEGDAVSGVVAFDGEREIAISARYGVVLNAGGFARNLELRERYGPHPASVDWTAVNEGDTGDAVLAAMKIGAATTNMDKVYWLPGLMNKDGKCVVFIAERVLPHSILVDASGSRFTNEAASYTQIGIDQYARTETVPAIPAYLIVDSRHRRRYPLGEALPGVTPRAWLKSGHLKRANTLRELAHACGIDPVGLERTVTRFNAMAERGVDEDFGRGSNAYDRTYGDPAHKPNPTLGPIARPPFYAAKMYPTDIGTAGGLLTDEYARVIGTGEAPIAGLYACGTSAASCMGKTYCGGGISLGQSSVFGMIAAEHIADRVRFGEHTADVSLPVG